MDFLAFGALFLGAILGFVVAWLLAGKGRTVLEERTRALGLDVERLSAESKASLARAEQSQAKLDQAQAREVELTGELREAEARTRHLEERLQTQKQEFTELRNQSAVQFENLANKILETNSRKFTDQNKASLDVLLSPLKTRIEEFQKQVGDAYSKESNERFALKKELERLMQLNQQMSVEAGNLTRALKGDSKAQGNWGEFVLEKILERSGLREGEEYTLQGEGMSLKGEDGKHFKPDVIVNLPEGKHLIIDSKVSLTAYEQYVSAEDEETRKTHLKAHADSIVAHIDGLSAKHYQALEKLDSPDFVFLFMPLEPAYVAAFQHSGDLFQYGWDKKIIVVSPTTLLSTLRTVASLWKHERQQQNALEIARQGGALYDKFADFVADLEKVGEQLDRTQTSYTDAMNKLKTGKGNLLNRAETLRKLGAKAKKAIDARHFEETPEASPSNGETPALAQLSLGEQAD